MTGSFAPMMVKKYIISVCYAINRPGRRNILPPGRLMGKIQPKKHRMRNPQPAGIRSQDVLTHL